MDPSSTNRIPLVMGITYNAQGTEMLAFAFCNRGYAESFDQLLCRMKPGDMCCFDIDGTFSLMQSPSKGDQGAGFKKGGGGGFYLPVAKVGGDGVGGGEKASDSVSDDFVVQAKTEKKVARQVNGSSVLITIVVTIVLQHNGTKKMFHHSIPVMHILANSESEMAFECGHEAVDKVICM